MGMDVYEKNDGEGYFRANVWAWRPLLDVIEKAGHPVPEQWHYNDGEGLDNNSDCRDLAVKLRNYLKEHDDVEFYLDSDMAVDQHGRFVERGTPGAKSPYVIQRDHVQTFIDFLEASDGFEIC